MRKWIEMSIYFFIFPLFVCGHVECAGGAVQYRNIERFMAFEVGSCYWLLLSFCGSANARNGWKPDGTGQ